VAYKEVFTSVCKHFSSMISHHFVELDELIIKMYSVWRFEIVFHKIIEENRKKIWVEISSPLKKIQLPNTLPIISIVIGLKANFQLLITNYKNKKKCLYKYLYVRELSPIQFQNLLSFF